MTGAECARQEMTKRLETSTSWRALGAERFGLLGAEICAPIARQAENGLEPLRTLNFLERRFARQLRATTLVHARQAPPLKGGLAPHHLIGLVSLLDKGFTVLEKVLRFDLSPFEPYETPTSWSAVGAQIVTS
jgi:hypothetical protein